MVLGHSGCGAVDAAIKVLKDKAVLPGHLPELISRDQAGRHRRREDEDRQLARQRGRRERATAGGSTEELAADRPETLRGQEDRHRGRRVRPRHRQGRTRLDLASIPRRRMASRGARGRHEPANRLEESLASEYLDTGCHVRADFSGGHNGPKPRVCSGNQLSIHIAATCLHYGQGMLRRPQGISKSRRNDRLLSAAGERGPACFFRAALVHGGPACGRSLSRSVAKLVQANQGYVPPFGAGASFYVRPLLIGTSAIIGVHGAMTTSSSCWECPSDLITRTVCSRQGWSRNTTTAPAPNGVGHVKAAGNYAAAALIGDKEARARAARHLALSRFCHA